MTQKKWIFDNAFAAFIAFWLVCIFIVFSWGGIKSAWKIYVSEKNFIQIYRGEEKIYEGKQAFTYMRLGNIVDSNHEIVEVIIYKRLFPYPIIDKTYIDRNIRVEPAPSSSKYD